MSEDFLCHSRLTLGPDVAVPNNKALLWFRITFCTAVRGDLLNFLVWWLALRNILSVRPSVRTWVFFHICIKMEICTQQISQISCHWDFSCCCPVPESNPRPNTTSTWSWNPVLFQTVYRIENWFKLCTNLCKMFVAVTFCSRVISASLNIFSELYLHLQ